MDEKSAKRNFQISNILIGLLMILFSIVVLMYPDVTNISVAFIFSLVLLIIGLGRVMNASSDETLSNLKAISRFISGVCALIISLVAIILLISDPAKGLELWYFLVAIALLIIGIMRVIVGLGSKKFENQLRTILIIAGILTVIFSIIGLLIPELAGIYIVILVSASFLINGIVKIILGIIGPK